MNRHPDVISERVAMETENDDKSNEMMNENSICVPELVCVCEWFKCV